MWVRTLSQQVEPSKVLVNHVCPGFVNTDLDKNLPFPLRGVMKSVRWMVGRDAEEGGRGVVYATIVADDQSHGQFITDNVIQK